jgi:hypothetical protein
MSAPPGVGFGLGIGLAERPGVRKGCVQGTEGLARDDGFHQRDPGDPALAVRRDPRRPLLESQA